MSATSFQGLLRALEAENFADGKLRVVAQAAGGNWFTVVQVREIMRTFNFGDDQVEAAILMHPRTVDAQDFYQVYEVLTFDSERDELRQRLGL